MSTPPTAAPADFPLARKGYHRPVVDAFVQQTRGEIEDLRRRCSDLEADSARLQRALAEPPAPRAPADFAELGVRAQEILAEAEAAAVVIRDRAAEEAEAVRAQGGRDAAVAVETARARAQSTVTKAAQEAAGIRSQAEEHRDGVRDETAEAQSVARRDLQAAADRAATQREEAAARLAAETEAAASRRQASLAEVERVRAEATLEADRLVAGAVSRARTIDERARQEFAWRRRQLRQEQESLTRRKQAVLGQLSMLGALAVTAAHNLPEVPAPDLDAELPADDAGPAVVDPAGATEWSAAQVATAEPTRTRPD